MGLRSLSTSSSALQYLGQVSLRGGDKKQSVGSGTKPPSIQLLASQWARSLMHWVKLVLVAQFPEFHLVIFLELLDTFDTFALHEFTHGSAVSELHEVGLEVIVSEPEIEEVLRVFLHLLDAVLYDLSDSPGCYYSGPNHYRLSEPESFVLLQVIILIFLGQSHRHRSQRHSSQISSYNFNQKCTASHSIQSLMPLIVRPIEANLTRDTESLGTMDPYCKIMVGQEMKQSKVHVDGGKRPMWNETFAFLQMNSLLKVSVWDSDPITDDLIGQGSLDLTQLYSNVGRTENQYVDLTCQGYAAGRILLSVEFQGQPGGFVQPGGFGQPVNPGWGQQPLPAQGWGQPPPTQGWGQQPPPAQGWGGQQPPAQGWGQQPPPNQGWGGQQPPNQGWGGQQPPNQGWGGQQPPNQGWGGQQPPNQGWGGQQPPNPGWGSGW